MYCKYVIGVVKCMDIQKLLGMVGSIAANERDRNNTSTSLGSHLIKIGRLQPIVDLLLSQD